MNWTTNVLQSNGKNNKLQGFKSELIFKSFPSSDLRLQLALMKKLEALVIAEVLYRSDNDHFFFLDSPVLLALLYMGQPP